MYQTQHTDLAQIFMAAQQMKAQEQEAALRQQQIKMQEQQLQAQQEAQMRERDQREAMALLPEAMQAAAPQQFGRWGQSAPVQTTGNSEMLNAIQQVAPQQVQAQQEYQRKIQQAIAEEQRKNAETAIKAREAQFRGVSPDWMTAANQVLGGPLTIENMYDITPEQTNRINALVEKGQSTKGNRVTINNAPNGQQLNPLTEGQRSQVQDKIEATRDTLFQINELRQLGNPGRFLGWANRAKNAALEVGAQVAPSMIDNETKQLIADDRRFGEINDQIFNALRRIITGAGASEKELNTLKQGVINKNLDEVSYGAALNRLEDFSRRAEATYARLLREGVNVTDPGYGERFDAEMKKAATQYSSKGQPTAQNTSTPAVDPVLAASMRAVQAGEPPLKVMQRLVSQKVITSAQANVLLPQIAAAQGGGQ